MHQSKVLINLLSAVYIFVFSSALAEDRAELVYSDNFENMALGKSPDPKGLTKVEEKCGPLGRSQCLRVRYEPFEKGSLRMVRRVPIAPGTAYTLQYDVRFAPDFEWTKGGKLHGLGPSNSTSGCKAQTPDGWSARVMWKEQGRAVLYIYDQDRRAKQEPCGFDYGFTGSQKDFPNQIAFTRGRYHAVSIYVSLNTAADKNDGLAELWIDGKLYAKKDNIRFRADMLNSDISAFLFSTFHGGNNPSWRPNKAVYADFDNFEVWQGKQVRPQAKRQP